MPLADISFGELLLVVVEIFLFVVWIWILFTIITDLFRDHEMSGWAKALWILFLVFIPFLTGLIYLIVRGSGMRDRAIKAQTDAKSTFRRIRAGAGSHLARRRTPQTERPARKRRTQPGGVRPGEGQAARLRFNFRKGAAGRGKGAPPPSTAALRKSCKQARFCKRDLQIIGNSGVRGGHSASLRDRGRIPVFRNSTREFDADSLHPHRPPPRAPSPRAQLRRRPGGGAVRGSRCCSARRPLPRAWKKSATRRSRS